ncbi:MAG: DUF4340 domain-containing protein [Candidatus Dadabacteria bacterium]|nr:DUF4340 domain-containing protein [Candidatus Dadabacteria bacterium]
MKYFFEKFKGALITALVFIILLGFIYFRDTERHSENLFNEEPYVFIGDEEVLSVEIYYSKSWILLESDCEDWFVIQDEENLDADKNIIDHLIEDIKNTEIVGTVPTNEVDLDQFGLQNAGAELVIITDERDQRFIIGDKIPVGSGTYVYVPNENIVLVVEKDYLKKYMNMSTIDFRDKGLFDFDSSQISRIAIWSGNFSTDIYKEDGQWFIGDQDQIILDDQDQIIIVNGKKIEEILWIFSRAKVLDFENENPESLRRYGLDEPTSEIRFYEDDQIHGVIFGKRKDENSYYVKSDSDDAVYSIHKSLFKRIPKNIDQISLE